ncbi:hypothetical protein NDU88_000364 [Pleurodeles waltl]|uniref:Uncharacterized protein n=1 Tax=Pleurodeles waltl TaxID=8319 RepID=A0AAV7LUE5_PLEWA|nr:hypothetical protein NDU88_000364 [Pleurodeles waltl]
MDLQFCKNYRHINADDDLVRQTAYSAPILLNVMKLFGEVSSSLVNPDKSKRFQLGRLAGRMVNKLHQMGFPWALMKVCYFGLHMMHEARCTSSITSAERWKGEKANSYSYRPDASHLRGMDERCPRVGDCGGEASKECSSLSEGGYCHQPRASKDRSELLIISPG